MKYTLELTIDLPRERVVELFDNVENLKEWQKGLQSFDHVSGEPGQVGAVSKLKYDMNGRIIDMIETITVRDLPDRFAGTYEAKGVWNAIDNRFEEVDENTTKWYAHNEFKFKGFMKLMSKIMPGAFKKQSFKFMIDFKNFAEKQ